MTAPVDRAGAGQLVREVIGTVLPAVDASEIRGDKHLKDLGADSVDRVEIVVSLMDRFGVDEPMSSFSGIPCIEDLIDFLYERSRA